MLAAVMVAREVPKALRFGRREDGGGERRFKAYRGREQLAPDAHDTPAREQAAVPGDEPADDLGLARRLIKRRSFAALGVRDLRHDLGALDQQVVQPVVDPSRRRRKSWRSSGMAAMLEVRCGGATVVGSGPGKIKENVDTSGRRSLPLNASPTTGRMLRDDGAPEELPCRA